MTVSLRRLTAPEFHLLTPELVDIYIDAMGYDPAIRSGRIAVWRQECRLAGFTSVIATERTDRGEFITGLAYGFSGTPRVWWHHQVMRGLKPRGLEDLGRDYFELAEIHVDPRRQSRGTGRGLLRDLVWNQPHPHVLLSTPEVENEANAAFHLYRSAGFSDVLRDFRFDGDSRRFAVLGAPLPLPGHPVSLGADHTRH